MIRVAIVGCGSIAGTHAWALSQLDNIEIAGFADIVMERAESFSQKYTAGHAPAFSDYTEMLNEVKPDAVHICTPHYLHVPMAMEAVSMGIAVFSEKPPAISMEQFNALSRLVADNNAKAGFCFQNRYNKTVEKTDEIINSGKLGKVTGARAFVTWRRDADYYKTDWKGRLSTEGGGALINQSIHTLDLMLRYLGKPDTVKASLSNHHLMDEIEVEDTVEAWLECNGGKRGCFYATTAYATDAPVILEIQCEYGSISMIDKTVTVRNKDGATEVINVSEKNGVGKEYWGNGHLSCIKDFYLHLNIEERFQNDIEGVRVTMETMMKIYDYR